MKAAGLSARRERRSTDQRRDPTAYTFPHWRFESDVRLGEAASHCQVLYGRSVADKTKCGDRGDIRLSPGGPAPPLRAGVSRFVDRDGHCTAERWGRAARLGWDVGEEVSGGARRRPGEGRAGTLSRERQIGEDLVNDPGILYRALCQPRKRLTSMASAPKSRSRLS